MGPGDDIPDRRPHRFRQAIFGLKPQFSDLVVIPQPVYREGFEGQTG
jgi:hypothetical protein